MRISLVRTILSASVVAAGVAAGTPAFAYASKEACESAEGTGKCCLLGLQDEGALFHWGLCGAMLDGRKPAVSGEALRKPTTTLKPSGTANKSLPK